jgi:hypothetical protein
MLAALPMFQAGFFAIPHSVSGGHLSIADKTTEEFLSIIFLLFLKVSIPGNLIPFRLQKSLHEL